MTRLPQPPADTDRYIKDLVRAIEESFNNSKINGSFSVTNHTDKYDIDEATITHAQLANLVGTLIRELRNAKIIGAKGF